MALLQSHYTDLNALNRLKCFFQNQFKMFSENNWESAKIVYSLWIYKPGVKIAAQKIHLIS